MTPQEVLANVYKTSSMVLNTYISDLSDADLMHRPGVGCNHLAWQLGHLIASEAQLLDSVIPGAAVKLPAGFVERYSAATTANDSPSTFHTKDELAQLMKKNEEAALKAIEAVTAERLSEPGPAHLQPMFPTVGSVLALVATHGLMHSGQFVPVRRSLGKPILI